MPREFRPYEPDQGLLLPPSLSDWLPEGHLAFFISDALDAMDLSAFEARYGNEGPGNQAFDSRMMVKVMVYAYATGTFSSRRIGAGGSPAIQSLRGTLGSALGHRGSHGQTASGSTCM